MGSHLTMLVLFSMFSLLKIRCSSQRSVRLQANTGQRRLRIHPCAAQAESGSSCSRENVENVGETEVSWPGRVRCPWIQTVASRQLSQLSEAHAQQGAVITVGALQAARAPPPVPPWAPHTPSARTTLPAQTSPSLGSRGAPQHPFCLLSCAC